MSESDTPKLKSGSTDLITSLTKGTMGAVPILGPLISEIIGNVIPNQRVDRIARFLELLEQRLSGLEKEILQKNLSSPESVDILEDAFTQAARATSQERLEQISNVVANGLSPAELNQGQTKRMLWLLGQLNDSEIVLLRSKLAMTNEDIGRDREFRQKHESLLAPIATHMASSQDEFEEAALKSSYRQHLHDLGLIRHRFKRPKRGEFPEFDDRTGMMKISGSEVTRLGKMLLGYLNLIPEWCQT